MHYNWKLWKKPCKNRLQINVILSKVHHHYKHFSLSPTLPKLYHLARFEHPPIDIILPPHDSGSCSTRIIMYNSSLSEFERKRSALHTTLPQRLDVTCNMPFNHTIIIIVVTNAFSTVERTINLCIFVLFYTTSWKALHDRCAKPPNRFGAENKLSIINIFTNPPRMAVLRAREHLVAWFAAPFCRYSSCSRTHHWEQPTRRVRKQLFWSASYPLFSRERMHGW